MHGIDKTQENITCNMFVRHIGFDKTHSGAYMPGATENLCFLQNFEMIIESMTECVFRASFIPSLKADHFPMLNTLLRLVSCIAETDTRKGGGKVKRPTHPTIQGLVERGWLELVSVSWS